LSERSAPQGLTRRDSFRVVAAAAALTPPAVAFAAETREPRAWAAPSRLVVLDWGLVQTVLALGRLPVGVPAPGWYDRYAVTPRLQAGVTDVGLLFAPNFELIQELAPDAILATPALAPALPLLSRIAPTEPFAVFQPSRELLARSQRETARLADFLGVPAAAAQLSLAHDEAMLRARARLASYDGRPIYLASPIDDRYVTVHTGNGLFDAILTALGLVNAWKTASPIGFAPVPLAQLTEAGARVLLLRTPLLADPGARLARSVFWQALRFVREGRIRVVEQVLNNGGLPSATRFATLLADALTAPDGAL
jgi:iron complex transport system substrate-binding protein